MNKLVLFLIIAFQLKSSIEARSNLTVINKNVKINDILDLECISQSNLKESNKTVSNSTINNGLNGFDIFIFKKDNVLINLFRTKLRIIISNLTDQGFYECGYYRFDKHGTLNYIYQYTWFVNITIPNDIPLRYAASNIDQEVNFKKVNLNIVTQNPIKITIIGVLLVAALFTIFLILNKNNMAVKSTSCDKLPTHHENTELYNKFIGINL